MNTTSGLFARLDGRPITNVDAYRGQSPLFYFGPLPANNLLAFFEVNAPAGATSPSVDAGFYLLLHPLSVGQHLLRVVANSDFGSIDTTFRITVVAGR